MKVLHILTGGKPGGIEVLCRELGKISRHDNSFCFVTFGGEIYNQMNELGIKTYPLFSISGSKFSIKKLIALIKLAKRYDALVVHHADPFVEIMYVMTKWIMKKPGIRYVHSCYGDDSQQNGNVIKRKIEGIIRQNSISCSEGVFVVSRAGISSCKDCFRVDNTKIKLIYNGIAKKYLSVKEPKSREGEEISILYAGRLEKIKGVDNLITAFSNVSRNHAVKLAIVGDGSERDNLEKLAKESSVSALVTFYGSQLDIGRYLGASDIFVYPSVCQEVFGISIVEAMAYGMICIANPVGGIPEIIVDEKNGFLTNDCSETSLELMLEKVIGLYHKDAAKVAIIKKNAMKTAKKYSILNTCRIFDDELEKIVIKTREK